MAEDSGAQEQFPGLDLAYGLVSSSYDRILTRLNAVEGRIQALMVFSASFLFTAPVLVATSVGEIALDAPAFYAALALAGVNFLAGAVMRALGDIALLGINKVREEWLVLAEDEFKLEAVRWSAIHFKRNRRIVNIKGYTVTAMTITLILEAASLTYWGLSQVA